MLVDYKELLRFTTFNKRIHRFKEVSYSAHWGFDAAVNVLICTSNYNMVISCDCILFHWRFLFSPFYQFAENLKYHNFMRDQIFIISEYHDQWQPPNLLMFIIFEYLSQWKPPNLFIDHFLLPSASLKQMWQDLPGMTRICK